MPEINLSPYTQEYDAIQRRRKMAELLQAQANQPLETNQMAGGYVVPVSPFAGLAKVLQGYTSGQIERDSTEKLRQLSERKRSDTTADMGALVAALTGSNELAKPAIQMPPEDQGGGPGRDAIPATGMMNPAFIQSMKTPEMQQMALQLIGQQAMPKTVNIVPEGGTAIQGSKVLYKSPRREEFSTTPHYETDPVTKQTVAVYANKSGGEDRRVPANPRDQFSTTSADSNAKLAQAERHWNGLSAEKRASLSLESQRTGVSVADLMFNTGMIPAPVAVPGLPQSAPQPQIPLAAPQFVPPRVQGTPQEALARARALDKRGLDANEASVAPQAAQQPLQPTAPPIPGLSPTPGMTGKSQQAVLVDQAKAQTEAAQKLPQTITMGNLAISSIDNLIGNDSKKINQHPGLNKVVGFTMVPGQRFMPGTDAADFDTRFKQIEGQTFLQAYQMLRGGGAITEVEGAKGTAAILRASRSNTVKEFKDAMSEARQVIIEGVENAQKLAGRGGGIRQTMRRYNPATGVIE